MSVFKSESDHSVPFFSQFLVEAQVGGSHGFHGFIVCCEFFCHLFLFEECGVVEVEVSDVFFADEGADLVVVVGHESASVLVDGSVQTCLVEGVLIERRVFIEVNFLLFAFSDEFCSEGEFVAEASVFEREFEIDLCFEVAFHNLFLLFGEFFEREVLVERHGAALLRCGERPFLVAEVKVEFLFFELIVNVSFVRSVFRCLGVVDAPVHAEFSEEVFTAERVVHCALALETCVSVVGCSRLGLDAHGCFVVHHALVVVHVEVFERHAVAVLPVISVVENPFEIEAVVFVDDEVKRGRVTLSFAGDVVLTQLVVRDGHFSRVDVFVPDEFHVIASCG